MRDQALSAHLIPPGVPPSTRLVELNLLKPQPLQQTPDGRRRIVLGGSQYAIGQGGLLQLMLPLLPHLRFQVRVARHQQPGLPGIHPRPGAVDARAEHLRHGKMQANLFALHLNIARLQIREINSGDNFAVHHHQKAISRQKVRKDRVCPRAGHNLVHGVDHGLEALQPLNAIDHRGLAYINGEGSAGQRRPHVAQHRSTGGPRQHRPSRRRDTHYPKHQPEDERHHNRRRRASRFGSEWRPRISMVSHSPRLSSGEAADQETWLMLSYDWTYPRAWVEVPGKLGTSQRNSKVADRAPAICATINIGASDGRIPAKVSDKERAMVTAGFANEVDAVNQ